MKRINDKEIDHRICKHDYNILCNFKKLTDKQIIRYLNIDEFVILYLMYKMKLKLSDDCIIAALNKSPSLICLIKTPSEKVIRYLIKDTSLHIVSMASVQMPRSIKLFDDIIAKCKKDHSDRMFYALFQPALTCIINNSFSDETKLELFMKYFS